MDAEAVEEVVLAVEAARKEEECRCCRSVGCEVLPGARILDDLEEWQELAAHDEVERQVDQVLQAVHESAGERRSDERVDRQVVKEQREVLGHAGRAPAVRDEGAKTVRRLGASIQQSLVLVRECVRVDAKDAAKLPEHAGSGRAAANVFRWHQILDGRVARSAGGASPSSMQVFMMLSCSSKARPARRKRSHFFHTSP